MANLQISTKFCTTLSPNSPKSRLVNVFHVKFWVRALYAIFERINSMYLWTCGSFKSANQKKDWVRKSQSAKCHICGRSAAICGTSLRTTHLCYFYESKYSLPSFSTQKNSFWLSLLCLYYLFSVLPMYYVHQNQILHRDLKSQNIFLTRQAKLYFYLLSLLNRRA